MKSPGKQPDRSRREHDPACWCGNEGLKPFSDDYRRCAQCETLVLRRPPKGDVSRVQDEEKDLYGKNYYLTRLPKEHGYPDLGARARLDLPERCIYWLRTVLKYKLPPARVLELGSAHGGFVAMLRDAGFDATGLELSPWLAKFARRTFDVPTLVGPIEDQKIRAGSLDVIAMMDVIEHLPDPLGTMRVCLKLLKPNGLLAIQTPHYLAGKTLEELTLLADRFLEQLKPDQHLYLFSQQSIREMFHRLGADFVVFEPAIFAHYDMFLITGCRPLPVFAPEEIQQALTVTPGGRVVQAFIDLDDQVRDLRTRYTESESDRAARLQVIHQQGQRLTELEAEVHRWLEETKKYSAQAQQTESLRAELNDQVSRLIEKNKQATARMNGLQTELEQERSKSESLAHEKQAQQSVFAKEKLDLLGQLDKVRHDLAAIEADRTRMSADIAESANHLARLQTEVGNLETERGLAQARLTELQQRLETSEADRAARLENIRQLEQLLGESERDRAARLGVIQTQGAQVASLHVRLTELQQRLESSEADRVAHGEEINKQQRMLEEADSKHKRLQAEMSYSKAHAGTMQATLQQLGHSHTYRVMRALGLWRSLDRSITAAAGSGSIAPRPTSDGPQKTLRRVVVDLTPVLPGADNGGAKLVAMELVRHLAQLAPSCEWVLLTSEKGHADLASLDSHNVRRVCVGGDDARIPETSRRPPGGLSRLGKRFKSSSRRSLLRELSPDIVFCPFTTARFFDPRVPMVTIVHDLQYLAYPELFSQKERAHRDQEFRNVCRFATRVICMSDYVRGTVLQHGTVDSPQVTTIHISLFHRLADSRTVKDADVLSRYGLHAGRFLLYPANYWPHKNHEMLLTAFGMYRARHPESDLKLVCTGGLSARREELQEAGARMGLDGQLILTEFLPNEEFAVLLRTCRAMVFPSLFEGFGMPVLEAMAVDKPVLCSNVTSLPEVVGDAAVLFDPRKPTEIVQAIEQVESDPELVGQLIQRGRNRLTAFDDATGMARRYLHVLQDALNEGNHLTPALHGVFSDGWTGERVTVTHNPSSAQRYLEMTLYAPDWLPSETLSIRLASLGRERPQTHVIKRGQTVTLRHRLPAVGGALEIQVRPTFQPQVHRLGADTRILGCLCRSCRILAPDEMVELFAEVPQA